MTILQLIFILFTVIILIPTVASLTKFDQWWVRAFDFPRLQISFLHLLLLGSFFFILPFSSLLHYLLPVLLVISFIYQAHKIFPYTFFAKKQVLQATNPDQGNSISIIVSNVLTNNDKYELLLNHISQYQPDLLLTLESDERWEQALSVIEKEYPNTVKVPQNNLYGMHLYSKLELEEMEVKKIITSEVPSIHGYVKLRSGKTVRIHCLHPKPPSPSEDNTSTNRDAELLVVGKDVKEDQETTLVFGDLNDVAWSRTTRLFQNISGLLDPRIGRGFFNTFHTKHPLFRWPLDHLFHTDDFTLIKIKRLKSIGSDHFPMFINLNHQPKAEEIQDEPESATDEEEEWTEEKIAKGDPKERDLKYST